MKRYQELDDATVNGVRSINEMREHYIELRDHHIEETTRLLKKKGPSILVVGPDRVGKTTIVKHLSEILNIPSFKCPAEKSIFKEGGRSSLAFDYTLTHFLSQTGHRFVSDRAYPCEWVYSAVFGRETDDVLLECIDSMHESLGTKILYLYSSVTPTEEDDLVPKERYHDVVKGYNDFCEWTKASVTAVDTKDMLDSFKNDWDTSFAVARRCIDLMEIK
jgi:energy-coupling factor transporter ATP-binding protein EcfA2